MNNKIFRKKSIEKIQSPDNLKEYIRVASPSVWALIISVVVLLLGMFVWMVFGEINSTIDTKVISNKGVIVCQTDNPNISANMKVKFLNTEGKISNIEVKDNTIYVCTIKTKKKVKDGVYAGKIVLKSYSPISFLFN